MSAAQTVNAQFDVIAIPPPAVVAVPTLHPALLALLAMLLVATFRLTVGRRAC